MGVAQSRTARPRGRARTRPLGARRWRATVPARGASRSASSRRPSGRWRDAGC